MAILRSPATRWLSTLKPAERLWDQYVALVLLFDKMVTEKVGLAAPVFDRLLDFRQLLALALMLPMLRSLNHLVKVCQSRDIFVHELAQVRLDPQEWLWGLPRDVNKQTP